MKVRHLFLSLLCLLVSMPVLAQTVTVKGTVRDVETREALAGAVVAEKGHDNGVITDENGKFSLVLVGKARVLTVSYVGYKSREHKVTRPDLKQHILLATSTIEMPTTTISDSRLQRVHPNKKLYLLDYHFVGEDIVAIVRDVNEKRGKLEVLDANGNSVDVLDNLDEEPKAFRRDCMGALHVLTKSFAYQLDYEDQMLIPRRDSLHHWEQIVEPCAGTLEGTYYYSLEHQRYVKQFIYIRSDEMRKRHLYASVDKKAIALTRDEAMMPGRIVSAELLGNAARTEYTEVGLDKNSLEWLLLKPSYVPLKVLQERAMVFDHTNKRIVKFDRKGQKIEEVPIGYKAGKNWQRIILTDQEQRRAFSVYEKNGWTTLTQIDLETGKPGKSWELPKTFVRNIKVKGNHIYFMYRDNHYDPVQKLYRYEM